MNKLGFGFLRLPVTPAGEIDLSLLDQMTDVFLAHGRTILTPPTPIWMEKANGPSGNPW